MRRRTRKVALFAAAFIVAAMPSPYDATSASCVGPTLDIGGQHRPTVTPGQRLTVTGSYFVDGCNDTGSVVGTGCSAHEQAREPVRALQEVTLSIRQHGHSWALGTTDADTTTKNLGDVTWVVTLPVELEPGRATLVTDRSSPLRIAVAR
jgi:hypothetical protein